MQIQRVVRDLVTTKRNFWLAASRCASSRIIAAISRSPWILSAPNRAISS